MQLPLRWGTVVHSSNPHFVAELDDSEIMRSGEISSIGLFLLEHDQKSRVNALVIQLPTLLTLCVLRTVMLPHSESWDPITLGAVRTGPKQQSHLSTTHHDEPGFSP